MGIPGEGARLENYEAFIAIVDTGNLTRAAARLKRSLQSISRSLTALEEHLGIELVRRTTRRAQPTEAGLAFYRRISVALDDIAAAEAALREATTALASLRRVVVASPSYVAQYGRPESPADLAHHACIVRSSAQDAKAWTFHDPGGTSERVAITGKVTTDNAYVVKRAMLSGLGIAVAPFFHFREAVEAGHAEMLLGDYTLPPIPVHAVWPASPQSPARVRRFVDLLAQRLKKELT
jgi:DNA-binding transcriptional LysR family regulator